MSVKKVDCHVEVTTGWLEPILDRYVDDMNKLVWPKIGGVDPNNMKVWLNNEWPGAIGGFDWEMNFKWIDIKWYEAQINHTTSKWAPKFSPTSIGSIYSISKSFFMHVGMLDHDFGIWGGEDVELSFKSWMCGG